MNQYKIADSITVTGSDGEEYKITPFRERNQYDPDYIFSEVATQDICMRPDLLAINYYGDFSKIGAIIDSNTNDIFSFNPGDTIYLPVAGAALE